MPFYRLYPVNREGQFVSVSYEEEHADDEAACRRAKELLSQYPGVEVWQGAKRLRCEWPDEPGGS